MGPAARLDPGGRSLETGPEKKADKLMGGQINEGDIDKECTGCNRTLFSGV